MDGKHTLERFFGVQCGTQRVTTFPSTQGQDGSTAQSPTWKDGVELISKDRGAEQGDVDGPLSAAWPWVWWQRKHD